MIRANRRHLSNFPDTEERRVSKNSRGGGGDVDFTAG